MLDSRTNIFDNDEFDLYHNRSVDASKIHKGKRQDISIKKKPDETLKAKIKLLATDFVELGNVSNAFASGYDEYDDEYDDTYDGNEIGADDADSADELMGRQAVLPVALGGGHLSTATDAPALENVEGKPDAFKERFHHGYGVTRGNPGGESKPNEGGTSNQSGVKSKYDVKGRAKGQGQSADVVKNRQFKSAHKSRLANHNRKAGADRKMAKGMF